MFDIYFSTVWRYAPNDAAGELVLLDWETKKVKSKVSVGPKTVIIDDPNPRGNSRGGRGIAVVDDKVIAASYCELQVYDRDLIHLNNITHNLMVGLHEVFYAGDQKLWLASTTVDAALLLDLNTGEIIEHFWPCEMPVVQEKWGIQPLGINKQADNRLNFLTERLSNHPHHLHFNAITVHQNEVYGLINRFGAVINLTRQEIIIENSQLKGCHNLIILEDGTVFINDTRNQGLFLYNLDGELIKRIDLLPFHRARRKVKWYKDTVRLRSFLEKLNLLPQAAAMPFFVRGLDIVGDLAFIGMSPAAILCVNWRTEELVEQYNYSADTRVAVHGLKVVPR